MAQKHRATSLEVALVLLLMVSVNLASGLMTHTVLHLDGSYMRLFEDLMSDCCGTIVKGFPAPTWTAVTIVAVYSAFELTLMKVLPGKMHVGPETATGHRPVYVGNGMQAYVVTMFAFLFASYKLELFPASIIYDHMGPIITFMNLFSLLFCAFLYLKGTYYPSTRDNGSSGSIIFDYYWGTELYPRVFGWDLKVFTNCRFGMMGWALIVISCSAKQHADIGLSPTMFASSFVQLVYIAKFFWWEQGYMKTIDIMHDRAGYYICWGCLVWVPVVYASPSVFLTTHPGTWGWSTCLILMVVGWIAIGLNYTTDLQRQRFRATNGNCTIWGSKPKSIVARYTGDDGLKRKSLLLVSGFWAVSRHFNYLPELTSIFMVAVPAQFTHFYPYFFTVFLAILLTHRAHRDEVRCSKKYGKYWQEYKNSVPALLIPGVY